MLNYTFINDIKRNFFNYVYEKYIKNFLQISCAGNSATNF